MKKFLLPVLVITTLAACKDESTSTKYMDFKTPEGKVSPYQGVSRIIIRPIVNRQTCDSAEIEVPNYLSPTELIPKLTKRLYLAGTFNVLKDRKYAPPLLPENTIIDDSDRKLQKGDFRLNMYFDYQCNDTSGFFSFRWEIERAPEVNAYTRKSSDRWWDPHSIHNVRLEPINESESTIMKKIIGSAFTRLDYDACIPSTNGPPPQHIPNTECR